MRLTAEQRKILLAKYGICVNGLHGSAAFVKGKP